MNRPVFFPLFLSVLVVGIGGWAGAQEAGGPASQPAAQEAVASRPDPRIDSLEKRQRELEARLARDEATEETHYGGAGGAGAGEGGFLLHSPDNNFVINFRGYIQADERFYLSTSPAASSTFLLRRVRPVFEGTVYRYFGFKIMPDFGAGATVLEDAWAEFRPLDEVVLTVGKMKPPVGIERIESARYISFVERGLPTNLVPNRDVGIQISGQVGHGIFQYAIGFFDGVIDNGLADGDTNDAKDLAGRVFLRPLRPLANPWLDDLGVGFSFSHGTESGTLTAPNLPVYRSISQLTFFSFVGDGTAANTVIASGDKTRLSPHGTWYAGPFGLLAEYVWTSQGVQKGTTTASLDFSAWQVAASFVIGGHPGFEGVKIDAPFDPHAGHYGALEIKARYSEQNNDPDAFTLGFADATKSAQAIHAGSFGLTWHFNRSYKILVDGEYAKLDGGAGGGADRGSETSILSRVQIAF